MRINTTNEVYLYTMHGRLFRKPIHVLKRVFFDVLFNVCAQYQLLCLLMTATMMLSFLQTISDLTIIDWSKNRHQQ